MLIWLTCLLVGHKTVSRVAIGEKYDCINQMTGLPDKGRDYTLVRLGHCARCGTQVHDGVTKPMIPATLAQKEQTEKRS